MADNTMTEDQVKAFYRAIGEVMEAHNVEAIAGVWLSSGDSWGQILCYDLADIRTAALVTNISKQWEDYLKAAEVETEPVGYVREISTDNHLNN